MSPHVLVISTKLDVATDSVVDALLARGVRSTRIDTEDFPFDSLLTTNIDAVGAIASFTGPTGKLAALGDVSAVWYRRIRVPHKPEAMRAGVYDFCLREARSSLLGAVLTLRTRTMSPPARIWAAEHKVLQLAVAREVGLPIPQTVVTNDPEEIRRAFDRFGGRMIGKPVKTGYVDYGEEQHAVFTSRILEEHLDSVDTARLSPGIFQPLIEKHCDVRVTIVGTTFFTAEIDSQSDPAACVDWRHTADPNLPHRKGALPPETEAKTLELMRRLGLWFAAIDFIRTPGGEYVFLEVNPNGQWLWLDDILGFGITEAVADWLSVTTP